MFGAIHESKTYGVKYQARSIAAVAGEKHHTQFLVGTLSLREENEVHLIQLADDGSDITCEGLFTHANEIWDIAACPYDPRLFSTVHSSSGEFYASIWKMPERWEGGGASGEGLALVGQLTGLDAQVKSVLWSVDEGKKQVVSLDEESIGLWSLERPKSFISQVAKASAGALAQISCGALDPHSPDSLATASETSISFWDLRSMTKSGGIESAHQLQIRDVDFNPKRPHLLMTVGDDSRIRVWDQRKPRVALVDLAGHSHWTWRARYNSFYDDLVISCGTDSVVNMWLIPSASSRTLGATSLFAKSALGAADMAAAAGRGAKLAEGAQNGGPDQLAASFSDFEDSVYGLAWSAIDPWVFASLSYDGRVVVEVVPDAIRAKCRT